MTAQPRFATPRQLQRPTLGPEVAGVMRKLGYEPMPWQHSVLDVAYELDEQGDYVYDEIVLVVPRQAGKTALLLAVQVHRALVVARRQGRKQLSMYTAQSGKDAVTKLMQEQVPAIQDSPFGRYMTPFRRTGSEAIHWENGSRHEVFAPTLKAGHGKSVDLVQVDEAFALRDDFIEQGLKPPMITRQDPQIWIVSAAGDDNSRYLKDKVELGRERTKLGQTFGSAYFEWSAADDMDSSAPETWRAVHPAIGHTIKEKTLASHFGSMALDEFERAYLARWPTNKVDRIISNDAWAAARDPQSTVLDPVTFCVDIQQDLSSASIVIAGERLDGLYHVEVVYNRQGMGWVEDTIVALLDRHEGSRVCLDAGSAAGILIHKLKDRDLMLLQTMDVCRSAMSFVEVVTACRVRHRGERALEDAVSSATKRMIGDKWTFGRSFNVDISPLRAASFALWSHMSSTNEPQYDWGILA